MDPREETPQSEEDPKDEIVRDLPPSPINDGCRTPIRKRQLPSAEKVESVPIVDLAQSPKRRKRSIGITPYSRTASLSPYPLASRTPTKGSILDIQMGKHTMGSPLPSPKPLPVITPPQSPLVNKIRFGFLPVEFEERRSDLSAENHAQLFKFTVVDGRDASLHTTKEFAKTGKLVTSFTEALNEKKSGGRVLFPDEKCRVCNKQQKEHTVSQLPFIHSSRYCRWGKVQRGRTR